VDSEGAALKRSTIRVLVVDDYEPWRRFVCLTLQIRPKLQIISEGSDGLEAVHQAQQLQPDLIVLDLGLPALNGIEAARRIRELAPNAKILFLSESSSLDIAEEALRTGAEGYVVKTDAANDLLLAVEAVLQGKRFVSASLVGHGLIDTPDPQTGYRPQCNNVVEFTPTDKGGIHCHHEVGFYSNERRFLDHLTRFVGAALSDGDAAIVAATESHRDRLIPSLQAHGVDIAEAVERGRYVALDATDALSTFMVNGMPDPIRFMNAFGNLILTAAKTAKAEHPRVAIFGECVHLLWAGGNAEAAIQMEKLGNQLTKMHEVNFLCGYSLSTVGATMDDHIHHRICAEHSAVHSY
jgi:DNA-binding NarL/FixJ family response regulator